MKLFTGVLLVILLLLATPNAYTLDSQLQKLQATQKLIRAHAEEYLRNNGGGPELTVFKHQLRDWIESKLTALDEKGDEQARPEPCLESDMKYGLAPSSDQVHTPIAYRPQ
jgi:hypothetical protein